MNNTETKQDVYTIVTNRIIEQLEKGTVPWKQPWTESGLPKNLITKRPYRGINVLLLSSLGYTHNLFLTFRQIKEVGGTVKKNEKSNIVVFWNWIEPRSEGNGNGNGGVKEAVRKIPFLRYYTVFNIEQCDGIPDKFIPAVTREAYPIPACEKIVRDMPEKPRIQHKEDRAYYNPLQDFVNIPKQSSFKNDESYYAVFFHELIHSTGHHKRLNRKELIQMSEFGSEPYSLEELIAEMGACYLESLAGIMDKQFDQNAAYLQGWLQKLKSDKRFIISASSHAQRATDFILNLKPEEKEESPVEADTLQPSAKEVLSEDNIPF